MPVVCGQHAFNASPQEAYKSPHKIETSIASSQRVTSSSEFSDSRSRFSCTTTLLMRAWKRQAASVSLPVRGSYAGRLTMEKTHLTSGWKSLLDGGDGKTLPCNYTSWCREPTDQLKHRFPASAVAQKYPIHITEDQTCNVLTAAGASLMRRSVHRMEASV